MWHYYWLYFFYSWYVHFAKNQQKHYELIPIHHRCFQFWMTPLLSEFAVEIIVLCKLVLWTRSLGSLQLNCICVLWENENAKWLQSTTGPLTLGQPSRSASRPLTTLFLIEDLLFRLFLLMEWLSQTLSPPPPIVIWSIFLI